MCYLSIIFTLNIETSLIMELHQLIVFSLVQQATYSQNQQPISFRINYQPIFRKSQTKNSKLLLIISLKQIRLFVYSQLQIFYKLKIKNQMKRLLFLTLLLALLLQASTLTCNNTYAFSNSAIQCIFDYYFTDLNCTQFQFSQCVWTQCVQWAQDDNGNNYCENTQTFQNFQWGYCTSKCCDSSVIYAQTYSSINQCQSYVESQYKSKVILFSVLSGVASFIVLTVIIIYCKRNPKCCPSLKLCLSKPCCRCPCFQKNQIKSNPQISAVGVTKTIELPIMELQQITQV